MSKIDELLLQFCQTGVPYKQMGELGKFYGGLSGKSKNDFVGGNGKFITYMNVYSNPALKLDIEDKVKISDGEKQHTLKYGDILFTASSETPDECGISSVITEETDEKLYLNSFCFFYRFDDPTIMLPEFAVHLFRSSNLRYQIGKTANGVTRFNVSKKLMEKVIIPIPSMDVQHEIASILDNFTLHLTELESELVLRRSQFEYYLDRLLYNTTAVATMPNTHGGNSVQLEYIAGYSTGRINASELNEDNYIGVDNLMSDRQGKKKSSYVPDTGRWIKYSAGDILLGNIRPYLKKIWYAENDGGTNGDVLVISPKSEIIRSKYLYYVLSSNRFFAYDVQFSKGAKMPRGDKKKIMKYHFSVPSLEVQDSIIQILDKFHALCYDPSYGIPAEIDARQKQYEFYRDRLLSF